MEEDKQSQALVAVKIEAAILNRPGLVLVSNHLGIIAITQWGGGGGWGGEGQLEQDKLRKYVRLRGITIYGYNTYL